MQLILARALLIKSTACVVVLIEYLFHFIYVILPNINILQILYNHFCIIVLLSIFYIDSDEDDGTLVKKAEQEIKDLRMFVDIGEGTITRS